MGQLKVKANVFKKIYHLLDRKDKLTLLVSMTCMLIASACDLLNPYFFALIINNIANPLNYVNNALNPDVIKWYLLGIMGGLAIFGISANSLAVIVSSKVAIRMSARMRLKTFANTQFLSAVDMDAIGGNSIITRITSDATQVEQFFIGFNTFAIKAVSLILGGFILSIYQLTTIQGAEASIWTILISYVSIFIFFGIAGFLIKKAMPYFTGTRNALDINNTIMNENIVGNKLIRIYNLEKNQGKRYKKGNSNLRTLSIKADRIMAFLMPAAFFFINISFVVVYLFAGLYAWNSNPADTEKTMQLIGIILSFTQYLMLIMLGLILVSQFGYLFSRGKVCAGRMFEVMDKKTSIKFDENGSKIETGNIKLKNVAFAYHESEDGKNKNVIQNINLDIPNGSSLGVIGQTGSGKSTFVHLITRLYDVTQGSIEISNHNIKTISQDSMRENISISLQDKVLLYGTIKSNILIGNPEASDEEIIQAAKNAEAWEFINTKEDKLLSKVEQRGSNLSGGQKQRISIARALLKKSKILIFDDSTSALDTITEKKILNNLSKNYKDVTKIIVSQKIKSIQSCDQIIVLNDGKIAQQGTHSELIKDEKGIYRKIYDSQNTSLEGV